MQRLADKVAIVTGGAAGIGAATCVRFAEEGARVVIADVDVAAGEALAAQITRDIRPAMFIATNVAEENSAADLVARVVGEFGHINTLVNNAAVFVLRGIDATPEEWRRSLEVNVMGTALVTKHVAPHMPETGAAIVNLGSISSFIAQPEFITYSATKAAIANMTRCMAMDLAAKNIRVNAVCPGTVWTQIVQELVEQDGLDRASADAHADWGGVHLLQRIADPREIANAILFLASDEASFITGENLMVDGGYTAK